MSHNNFCLLYYSETLSLPIIGKLTYLIQIRLLDLGILKVFLASNKNSKPREILFKSISNKFGIIYCRSFKFGRNLKFFKNIKLILDMPYVKAVSKMERLELYDLMWSLVFCEWVTKRTKRVLKGVLPLNYPVVGDVILRN